MPRRDLSICSSYSCIDQAKAAVGKYWLPRRSGCESGWFAVCEDCARAFAPNQSIEYYDSRKDEPEPGNANCSHVWDKRNLVTLPDGTDDMVCAKCGAEAKRRTLGDF